MHEIGADELALAFGKRSSEARKPPPFRRHGLKRLHQVAMPTIEILQYLLQLAAPPPPSEIENALDDMDGRVLSVGFRSRGSVAGLNGRTITREGSGRR